MAVATEGQLELAESNGKPPTERDKWLAARRLGIGSSDIASLFPEDTKYGCTRELVFEKRGTKPDFDRTENEQALLKRGTKLESLVAEEFSEKYGLKVRKQPMFVDPQNPVRRVSIDYQIVKAATDQITGMWPELKIEGECGPGILECKTTNVFDYQRMTKEGIITDYVYQLQYQLGVKGYKWGVFAVLEPDWWKLIAFAMAPESRLIAEIDRRVNTVWEVVADKSVALPPALPSGDSRCYSCLFRKTCRGIQYLDEYAPIQSKEYVEDDTFSEELSDLRTVRDKLAADKAAEEKIVSAVQKKMLDKGQVKISVPSVGATVRWQEQIGANKWDGKGLDAKDGEIGRKLDFANWVQEIDPSLVVEFQREKPSSPLLSDEFKYRSAPTRPFVVDFEQEGVTHA